MKQRTQIILAIIGLSVLGIFLYFNYSSHTASEKHMVKKVELGVIQPLTGELGNFGKTVLNGIYMAIDDFQDRNPNIQISLHVEDSQAKAAVAISALRKLRDVDNVSIIIGSLTSSATLAMAPIANRSHILLMSPTASNPSLSNAGPYFYRVWTSDSFDGRVAAEYVRNELSLAKVGILYLNNDYGVGLKDVFSSTFTNLGGQVLFTEGYLDQQADFRTALVKVKNMNLDGLYLPGQPQGIGRILKQAKELGIALKAFSCVAAEDQEFLRIAGNAAHGLFFTAPAFDMASDRPKIKAFVEEYSRRFSEKPDTHAIHGYDAAAIILSGIEKGLTSPEQLRSYLDGLGVYNGLSGDFYFDTNGDVVTAVAVKHYDDNGNIKIVKIVTPQH